MSSFTGVHVSDQWLQTQFTQLQLLNLKDKFVAVEKQNGMVTIGDLPPLLAQLRASGEVFTEEDIRLILRESESDMSSEAGFEGFLRAYLNIQARAAAKLGNSKNSSSFLNSATTTLLHTISESEKASYVAHINSYLKDDPFLKQFLPIDPTTNYLFELAKDGVLLCKLINVAVPNTIDERAINTKRLLNPWERNENHTLCLNSAKAIGCTVVNIGTEDLVEGRPHLVLGLISQIIKIQLLADLNLRKTPQLVELVEDNNEVEEIMALAPEKVLLKWMNFHLKKAGYRKEVTNFSSDLKDGEAYAYLLNVLAPEHSSPSTLDVRDPAKRANLVLEHAEKMDCKRYLTPEDIIDGSPNLNLAFVAQIFHQRNGLSTDSKKISFAEMMTDDEQISREERWYRLWINSLGISSYVNHMFEDVRSGWILLEVLDKVSPGSVNWKQATKPPIKMPFRKVENCNQVIKIGKQLKFSLVNVAGNDFVQGNKKLILAFLWQLMRFNMLQLLKNLRSRSQGKEITDSDILTWANQKVRSAGRTSQMESFKDKNLSTGLFFLELLSAVEPRVVNWNLVTKGESDEKKKLNATYIISVARKLGCSIFLLPEDIMEVNHKMILMLTASIMYWSLQHSSEESKPSQSHTATSNGNTLAATSIDSELSTFPAAATSVDSELSASPAAANSSPFPAAATSVDSESSASPAAAKSSAFPAAATSVDSEASAFPAAATSANSELSASPAAAASIDSELSASPVAAKSSAFPAPATSANGELSAFPTAATSADSESSAFPASATSADSESSAFPASETSADSETSASPAAATSIASKSSASPVAATSADSESSAFPASATSADSETSASPAAATSIASESSAPPVAAKSSAFPAAATSADTESSAFPAAATSADTESSAFAAAATSADSETSAFPVAASPLDSVNAKSSSFTTAACTAMDSPSACCMDCYSPLTPAIATSSDAVTIANLSDEDEYSALIQREKERKDTTYGSWRGFELDY